MLFEIAAVVSKSKECIFCDHRIKRIRGRNESCVKATSSQKIEDIARILMVQQLETKVQFCQTSQYVMYHRICFQQFSKLEQKPDEIANAELNQDWKNLRDIHSTAFKQLKLYLTEKILQAREILALSDVHNYYMRLFIEVQSSSHPELAQSAYKPQHLLDKILKEFDSISKIVYVNRTYLHPDDMQIEEMLAKGFERKDDMKAKIKLVGMEIRKSINRMETRKLPKNNISVKDIIEGECDIPEDLYLLIETIVQSPYAQTKNQSAIGEIKRNKISTISNSIIFTASNGLIKPSTCLTLALSTKSITGSRRMINILNRMGYCVSYNVAEEIETELAYSCSNESRILPFDLSPEIVTHMAFDNYDQYVETTTGKDTLHDTVGIAFQNNSNAQELSMNPLQESINDVDIEVNQNQSRRRLYVPKFDATVAPYSNKNNPVTCFIGCDPTEPENAKTITETNTLWMLHHALLKTDAKKWFAYYTERLVDQNPIQKIGYLPIINASPTSDAVVFKTLEMALKLADECNQRYMIVTYDLAIASKAIKICADTDNKFDRLFINLGAFHIELAYFKVSIFIVM